MKIEAISQTEHYDDQKQELVSLVETVMESDTSDIKVYNKLVKCAKESWRSLSVPVNRLVLTDASGVVHMLQFVRLPYPHHPKHRWVEVREWLERPESYRYDWHRGEGKKHSEEMQEWFDKAIGFADDREKDSITG